MRVTRGGILNVVGVLMRPSLWRCCSTERMNWEKFWRVEGSSMVSCAELLDSFWECVSTVNGGTGGQGGTVTRGLFSKPSVMAFSVSLYSSSVPFEG